MNLLIKPDCVSQLNIPVFDVMGRTQMIDLCLSVEDKRLCCLFPPQPYDSLPTSQTCFFQLRLPPYSSQAVMAERLRYAINNCRSIDMDNYMLSRNVDNAEGSDTDY